MDASAEDRGVPRVGAIAALAGKWIGRRSRHGTESVRHLADRSRAAAGRRGRPGGRGQGAIFDLDGTLLRWPSSETRFIIHAIRSGHSWARAAGRWAMRVPERGFRDNKSYFAGLAERDAVAFGEACFDTLLREALDPVVCNVAAEHREAGDVVGILTGAPQFLVDPVGRFLGVDFAVGTQLVAEDGLLTGELAAPRPYGQEKRDLAKALANAHGFSLETAAAYGNEMADRFLLEAAGRAVVVNPSGKLWRLARQKGWQILPAY